MVSAEQSISLRRYRRSEDAEATYATFRAAIHETAAHHYRADQVEAWAGPQLTDLSAWDGRRDGAFTVVAELDATVVGFADLRPDGLVDMLFVHPRAGGRGAGSRLLRAVLAEGRRRDLTGLHAFVSLVAEPVFARQGFQVVDRRANAVRGVVVPNAEMRLAL
ncbi:GNAT family N-acetyltransferase [Cellulomonas sp. APG4]|uniref:GNAT family N-acetyltransferase n=1 Tax=Cellulomonas sp. APG4 TaxID=1538656 RepID=UPI00137B58D3|nr:GNAT family N-acetyltransferase [Cellulomonas sp. APG4]NCT90768.1 GNAT family N-acetyltransferase [Cellulomonas sp. APG4]